MVIFATYLYSGPDRRNRPPAIKIASYEKTTLDNGYTPTEDVPSGHLNPLETVSLSTSRPGSPLTQNSRSGSARGKVKRDD
jgi:UDP-sugar transporter A1/2/3